MDNIIVRKVVPADVVQLQKIGKETFSETFAKGNMAENLEKYLEEGFSLEKLTAEINNKNSAFYFAVLDEQIIGYLKLNSGSSQTELQDDNALEIERIYVLREFHGKKAGQILYEKAIEVAYSQNAVYVWLGVWEENQRAIRFYEKNGFVTFDKHIFKLGNDEQTDLMMRKKL
ncbi:N-acetyltransferase [Chitinophaga sp. OAE865]|uniref:GNAT family N-acetyltransferase n=1 Tax=Chitinophaga sp. OAE865 TaxID=2817898 RepID=UPI001AE12B12